MLATGSQSAEGIKWPVDFCLMRTFVKFGRVLDDER
jgi:hypothetical protein